MSMERRFLSQQNASLVPGSPGAGAVGSLEGLAVPYNVVANIGGGILEKIAPGAFSGSLGTLLFLYDHDLTRVLARTENGSLRVTDKPEGLFFRARLVDTTDCRDAMASIKAGLVGGCSIGFYIQKDHYEGTVRVVDEAKLEEISIVSSWPAYEATYVETRSKREFNNLRLLLDTFDFNFRGPV